MGVGLPLALLALLGVGIPLWLHRVRRRTLREVALPTIALLSKAVAQQRRTLSFRDRPLLYARIALTALFAFALSRPFLSRIASYASERPIALAIVIDDSMSMDRKARLSGNLLEAAAARAERVLGELAPDSEASLILGGNEPRLLTPRTTDLPALKRELSRVDRVGARGTALARAVQLAQRELGASRLAVKEVLVLTDCAAHAGADRLAATGAGLRIECIPTRESRGNLYVASMALSRGRDLSEPATLSLTLGGHKGPQEVEVSVRIDGKQVAEASVPMTDDMGSAQVAIPQSTMTQGRVLELRIDTPNALAADDQRAISLDEGSELSVLLVDGDPAPNQLDDELRFLAVALAVDDGSHAAPRVTRIDTDGLASTDLASFDVVVLSNVLAPSDVVAERLDRHVARGGGLLITAGEHVDAFAYRGRMSTLLPAIPRSSAPADPPIAVDLQSVLASDLLPDAGRGLETARVNKRLLVEPPIAPSTTLLNFADGTPLLVAGRYQNGRIALMTTTVDDDWGDLPLTPGFLPLMHGLIRGLAAVDALPKGPHPAGTALTARVPTGARSLYVVTPDGRRLDLDAKRNQVRIEDTSVPGIYRSFASFDERGEREIRQLSFTVVADTQDSELGERRPGPAQDQPGQAGAARPRGVENWFWLLLGLAAIAEGALRLRRRPQVQASAA
ncbi:MAG: VWA domain-containing protein [Myxococcales bacterium]